MSEIKNIIAEGKSILGIEFGSTRIKAVLIEPDTFKPIAQGAHEWENRLEDGLWTYHLDLVWITRLLSGSAKRCSKSVWCTNQEISINRILCYDARLYGF